MSAFQKSKEYLICVDSDGCAMDTMDCKHIHCFGPCLVAEWGLEQWKDAVLLRWNEINLYTMTRGINRFQGLGKMLEEIDRQYQPVDGLQDFLQWVNTATELSNDALDQAAKTTAVPVCCDKALAWSRAVNRQIALLPEEAKLPFPNVREGLQTAHEFADVVVVSSANRKAVLEEWETHGLLANVDLVLAQDAGSKAHCIGQMLKHGYAPEHVLMIGDAPGDQSAARQNGVWYYPILVGREGESWQELRTAGFERFLQGGFREYGEEKYTQFLHNLGCEEI